MALKLKNHYWMKIKQEEPDNGDHYFQPYLEHSKTLKTWFVAYGVGGPLLFATQKNLIEKILDYGFAMAIVSLMLIGTFLQILITFLQKTTNYQYYLSEINPLHYDSKLHKISIFISRRYYWLLPVIDLVTIVLYVIATVLVFVAWS